MSSNAYTVNIVNADELYVAGAKISGFTLGAVKESGSNVGLNTDFPTLQLDISGTGAIRIPTGTTAERDFIDSSLIATGGASDYLGVLRFNKQKMRYEATYEHTSIKPLWGNFVMEDEGGNVGIGTDSPNAKLEVADDVLINGLTVGRGSGNHVGNTAIGIEALNSNTYGSNNTANGYQALYSNTAGSNNTANGYQALSNNITGHNNTANGYQALSNTTGSSNTANGYQALRSNTSGTNNTANGYQALYYNTGSSNTANGYYALRSNTNGHSNTANGISALRNNTTGYYNTAVGLQAFYYNKTGKYNVTIGMNSGMMQSPTNLDNTICIGYGSLVTASNQCCIGNDSIAETYLKGNVGIGTTTPTGKLDIYNPVDITSTISSGVNNLDKFSIAFTPSSGGKTDSTAANFRNGIAWTNRQSEGPKMGITSSSNQGSLELWACNGRRISLCGDSSNSSTPWSLPTLTCWKGKVGIGTDSPGYNLDVAGTMRVTGNCLVQGNITGNVSTATRLQTSRYIGGVLFNGSANISLPGVNANQTNASYSWAGNAGSVTNGVYTNTTQTISGQKTHSGEVRFQRYDKMSYINYSTNGDWYIRSGKSAGKVILQDSGGNVGIGTSSPGYKLDVNGTLRVTGTITGNISGSASSANQANYLKGFDDRHNNSALGTGIRTKFGSWGINGSGNSTTAWNFVELITLNNYPDSSGGHQVAIGCSKDTAYLRTYRVGNFNNVLNYYVNVDMGSSSSDSRIKKNIKIVPDNIALDLFRKVHSYQYDYINPDDDDDEHVGTSFGYLAQNVREHYEVATRLLTDVIPNEHRIIENPRWTEIYDNLNNKSFKLTIPDLKEPSGNTLYKFKFFYDVSMKIEEDLKELPIRVYNVKSLENEPTSFIFDEIKTLPKKVYILGKYIDDFHRIFKKKLHSLHYAASKDIDRIQQEEKTKLEEQTSKLEEQTSKLEEQTSKLEEQTSKLEEQTSKLEEYESKIGMLDSKIGMLETENTALKTRLDVIEARFSTLN